MNAFMQTKYIFFKPSLPHKFSAVFLFFYLVMITKDIIWPGQEFQLYWLSSWLPELYCTTQTIRTL